MITKLIINSYYLQNRDHICTIHMRTIHMQKCRRPNNDSSSYEYVLIECRNWNSSSGIILFRNNQKSTGKNVKYRWHVFNITLLNKFLSFISREKTKYRSIHHSYHIINILFKINNISLVSHIKARTESINGTHVVSTKQSKWPNTKKRKWHVKNTTKQKEMSKEESTLELCWSSSSC